MPVFFLLMTVFLYAGKPVSGARIEVSLEQCRVDALTYQAELELNPKVSGATFKCGEAAMEPSDKS